MSFLAALRTHLTPGTARAGALSGDGCRATGAAAARRAVFLDKDGTLVVDVPYNVDPAKLRFTPHALEGLQHLQRAGYAIVVVTNQPGLAAGRFSRAEFARLQRTLVRRVRDEAGVELAGFYTCPHAPAPTPALACLCRKPAPGLLRQAALALHVDLQRSWMVGDILDDVEAGHRAGCRTVLLDVGNETVWRRSPLREPDHYASDVLDAARLVIAADAASVGAESLAAGPGRPSASTLPGPPGAGFVACGTLEVQ